VAIINKPKVFVVIPNKNGMKHLIYSISSLMKTTYDNYYTVVIDDNSEDDSVEFIKRGYSSVKVLENENSKGFAGGVNTGIKYALGQGADYIAIANSDIKVLPEWIKRSLEIFYKIPDAGLIGFTEVPLHRSELFYKNQNLKLEYKQVKSLPGCLYLCPSKVFKHIGFFDEKYYMYGEDNDFFIRLRKAGYLILQTNIPVWHYGEGATRDNGFMPTWLACRNALRCAIKNESVMGVFRILLALFYHGCNPFLDRKINEPVLKRMRRYNVLISLGLILGSCFWNLTNIISTLKARYKENLRIRGRYYEIGHY